MKPSTPRRREQAACKTIRLGEADLPRLHRCLKRHWKGCRKALRRAQKDSSEEPVHDSRVEARRLLAVLDLLLPLVRSGAVEKIERMLKKHLAVSGELRDTQVQLLAVTRLQREAPEFGDFAAFLAKRERRLTKKFRRKLENAKTGRLSRLVDVCRRELRKELKKGSGREICTRIMSSVDRVYARTRELHARIDADDTATIHRTRVSFKKFRYMAEAVTELLPHIDESYTRSLREYQGLMGEIQDREVLLETFSGWVRKAQPDAAWAAGAETQLKSAGRKLVRAYLRRADKLLEFWPLSPTNTGHRGHAPNAARRSRGNSPERNGAVQKERPGR